VLGQIGLGKDLANSEAPKHVFVRSNVGSAKGGLKLPGLGSNPNI
jgi:hypothetical protein